MWTVCEDIKLEAWQCETCWWGWPLWTCSDPRLELHILEYVVAPRCEMKHKDNHENSKLTWQDWVLEQHQRCWHSWSWSPWPSRRSRGCRGRRQVAPRRWRTSCWFQAALCSTSPPLRPTSTKYLVSRTEFYVFMNSRAEAKRNLQCDDICDTTA